MSADNTTIDNQDNQSQGVDAAFDVDTLKNKYRAEYTQKVKNNISVIDMMFKNKEGRLKKIEKMTNDLLDHDIANGTLQAREQAEIDEKRREQEQAEKVARENPALADGNFDYMGWTDPHGVQDKPTTPQVPIRRIELQIPNVSVLQSLPDGEFLKYVLQRLYSYNIGSAAYSEPKELDMVNKKAGGRQTYTPLLMILDKKFEIVSQLIEQPKPDGTVEEIEVQNVERRPYSKDAMYLCYSEVQDEYIKAAAQVVQSFNAHGKIGLRAREVYILEEIEEIIRTSGYPPTQQYADFCEQQRHNIAMQLKTFGGLRNEWNKPSAPVFSVGVKANLVSRPIAQPQVEPAAVETPAGEAAPAADAPKEAAKPKAAKRRSTGPKAKK